MDVLGFENILRNAGLEAIRAKYAVLIKYVRDSAGYGLDIVPTPDGHLAAGGLVIGNAYFSDSILFWTDYSGMSIATFTGLIADAVCFGIEVELPLRGAIALGDLILDSQSGTFLGEPLVEAARTEREQQWIGVSFGPSFLPPPFNHFPRLDIVSAYKGHYKSLRSPWATGMVVDWPRRWRESRKSDVRPMIGGLDRTAEHSEYYRRTLAFVDYSEQTHDWFKRQKRLGFG